MYRRHVASGQARVTLDGHTHYLGKYGTSESREKYDCLIAEWLATNRQSGRPRADHGPSVVEAVLAYDQHAAEYYRNSPKERDKVRLSLRPLTALYGRSPIRQFDSLALEAVRDRMIDADLARTTINERICVIKRFIRWAVQKKLAPAAVYGEVCTVGGLKAGRTRARETTRIRPAPDADVDAVVAVVNRHVAALIKLQRVTGARSGELVIMRARDIDMTDQIWVYKPTRHKTQHLGRVREIFLGRRAQDVIKPFLGDAPDVFLFSPAKAREERYVLLRQQRKSTVPPSQRNRRTSEPKRAPGRRYTTYSLRKAVVTACKKIGVPTWFPHQLRHAVATRLRREFGLEAARTVLGHASASVTERYAAQDRDQARTVMDKVG
jgi:integrase